MSSFDFMDCLWRVVNAPFAWAGNENADSASKHAYSLWKITSACEIRKFDIETAHELHSTAVEWAKSARQIENELNSVDLPVSSRCRQHQAQALVRLIAFHAQQLSDTTQALIDEIQSEAGRPPNACSTPPRCS